MILLQIAWRNLWRNKRRSFIILTSIIIGVAAMDWMDGLARGYVIQMLTNQLGAHTAHLQIHAAGFNDNKVVQNYMADADSAIAAVRATGYAKNFSRRIVAFGLLLGALPFLVGLAVVLPILGHATWHLYRKLVVTE